MFVTTITNLITFGIIFLSSLCLTGLIRCYVIKKNILDIPNNRSSHQIPTPRGGGIAIVILFTLISVLLTWQHLISLPLLYALSGGIIVALMGWIDDIISIPPIWRASAHVLAASWAVYWLHLSHVGFGLMNFPLAVFMIVWSVNLYNFMDGIDGLAGIEGLFISISAALFLSMLGIVGLSLLCFLLAAAILGFLFWNWPPAKIFMGDVGSGYLGFIFAVLAIATAHLKILPYAFWITILAVFLCDATYTLLYRIFQGKRWYEGHREHAYQRLVQYGLSHKNVTVGVLLVNIFILLPIAHTILHFPLISDWIVIAMLCGFFLVWVWIQKEIVTR